MLKAICQQVRSAVENRRIGRPVAVRAYLFLTDNDDMADRLLEGAAFAAAVFGSMPTKWQSQGSLSGRHATVHLRFSDGETALITASRHAGSRWPHLTVLGTQGAAYFDGRSDAETLTGRLSDPPDQLREELLKTFAAEAT